MEKIAKLIEDFSSLAWGLPLLILLMGGGLYLLILSKFLPFRFFGHAIQVLRGKFDDPNDPGEISHFKALTTALSSTIGMGNIAIARATPAMFPIPIVEERAVVKALK